MAAGKEKLEAALKGTDTQAIKDATAELTDVFQNVSARMYQQAGQAHVDDFTANNPGAGAAGGGNGQDYVDADYEVVDDDQK